MGNIRPVCLLTDFGLQDPYVGIMKSVLQKESPYPPVIDLTHEVPPQDETVAAFLLEYAYSDLPRDSVVLLVVDPKVGTDRDIVVFETKDGHAVVAPDRSLVDGLPIERAVRIDDPPFSRADLSSTFHGRDWFAPAGRYLATGGDPDELGHEIDYVPSGSIVPEPEKTDDGVNGEVIYVDRFGNLVTNIHESLLGNESSDFVIELGDKVIRDVVDTYGNHSGFVGLVGSFQRLEIALPGGSARDKLGENTGTVVHLRYG